MKYNQCRTVIGLLKALRQRKGATLTVYSKNSIEDMPGAWEKNGDRITLNLGNNHLVIIGEKVYDEIRDSLHIVTV